MDVADGSWVMVVEDDRELREEILLPALVAAGFNVVTAGSAREMYRAMLTREFGFFVVDIGLPDEDGFSVVRYLRSLTRAGVLLLSGRARTSDKVRGLELGADAYLTKPIDAAVVIATLRSIARRVEVSSAGNAEDAVNARAAASHLRGDGWAFDLARWRLLAPNKVAVSLSVAERELLSLLLDASGDVVPRKRIVAGLAGKISGFEAERLEMLIFRLRRKASEASQGMELPVHTVRGVGYALAL